MRAAEPALLDKAPVVVGLRLRIGAFRKKLGPQHRPVRLAVLIDGQCLVRMLDRAAEAGIVKLERAPADVGEVAERDADRADRIPYADHLDQIAEVVGAA